MVEYKMVYQNLIPNIIGHFQSLSKITNKKTSINNIKNGTLEIKLQKDEQLMAIKHQ